MIVLVNLGNHFSISLAQLRIKEVGEIIDEQALAGLLFNKKIGGAGLDVFEHEPQITPKLLESKNVILLPHISSATIESRLAMGERVIKKIKFFSNGKSPPDLVNPIYHE